MERKASKKAMKNPSFKARLMNLLFFAARHSSVRREHDYEGERRQNEKRIPKSPKGVRTTEISLDGIHAERTMKDKKSRYTVFYIHGGGFTTGSARQRRDLCQFMAGRYGCECIANDYRLSPENKWPAHLEDCHRAYLALLRKNYEPGKIVFMGESAGGTLALSLALQLKEEGNPLPGAVVAFSPCTNQAEGFPSHRENAGTDAMLGDAVNSPAQYQAVFGSEQPDMEKMRNPLISPYYGDYEGMPPVFLAASDTEALYDDAVKLYTKLKKEGHIVGIDIKHRLFHAYPMMTKVREARETLDKAFRFIEKYADIGEGSRE